jgi:hypothetical protein
LTESIHSFESRAVHNRSSFIYTHLHTYIEQIEQQKERNRNLYAKVRKKQHIDVLFYTSVHILWLVKLTLGCCIVVNDLECEIIDRDGGSGGVGSRTDADERFRLGNGSEFPSKSIWPPLILPGRRFVVEVDRNVRLPSDVFNSVAVRFLCPVMDFRGTTGAWLLVWFGEWRPIKRPNWWRFRCSITITQTR